MSVLESTILEIREKQQNEIKNIRFYLKTNFPDTIKALCQIDTEVLKPKRRKGYNLVVRESKKYGRRLFARFTHNGQKIPTKFNTFTNNEKEAEIYILKNKERLIEEYYSRKTGKLYRCLNNFYTEQTNFKEKRRREISNVIKNKFVPYLKNEKIIDFGQITKKIMIKFQDILLKSGIRPQTVNNNMKAIKRVFDIFTKQNLMEQNPCELVKCLKVKEENKVPRGCYELEKIKDVFCRKWKDELSYFLCLLIYTTGMRNSEIKRIKLNDIKLINGCYFINIKESKTANGVRQIPLHKNMYEKIRIWGLKNNIGEKPLFDVNDETFSKANKELARRLKVNDEELEKENITFYSGRHYWKTLMRAEGLGEDIEEVWMGHKVSGNVARLYNHQDKQGKTRMIKKAKQMFSILDRCIFKTKL